MKLTPGEKVVLVSSSLAELGESVEKIEDNNGTNNESNE